MVKNSHFYNKMHENAAKELYYTIQKEYKSEIFLEFEYNEIIIHKNIFLLSALFSLDKTI